MNEIKVALLRKLAKHGYWGDRHTAFDNLSKGFPGHYGKEVKAVAKELIRENILLPKPTSYGLHVSLNPKMKEVIEGMVYTDEFSETK